jgi:hypothetical protein
MGEVRCKLLEVASERCRDIFTRLRDGESLSFEIPADIPEAYIDQANAEIS